MNIIIVTSLTGGHFYPAIEVAKQAKNFVDKIIFISQKSKNLKFVEIIKKELNFSEKLEFEYILTAKFIRKNPLSLVKILIFFLFSSGKILNIIFKYKPKILFSTGGYTSFPVVILTKIFAPLTYIILHEQNSVLSLSNKLLSFIANKVYIGLEIKKRSSKFIFTGNPLRKRFLQNLDKEKIYEKLKFKKDNFTILVFGGSQGAKAINYAFLEIIKNNKEKFKDIQIVHITGFYDIEAIKHEYQKIDSISINVFEYYENMEELYTIADLVISRAGAMTVSELIFFRKPAILIPLPTAAELHQHWNAQLLKKYQCAKVIYQKNDWKRKLQNTIFQLIEKKETLSVMRQNYEFIPKPKTNIETEIKNILYIKKYARRKYKNI